MLLYDALSISVYACTTARSEREREPPTQPVTTMRCSGYISLSTLLILISTSLRISAYILASRVCKRKSIPFINERSIKPKKGQCSLFTTHSVENIAMPLSLSSTSRALERTNHEREISRMEKFSRLPVWPVWNGVLLFFMSRIFGDEFAARIEQEGWFGGRVCPNFFRDYSETSPFIMLVHHSHSFAEWDLIRFFQRSFFPEGFPAHPHRGFITVTYVLKGGFRHRDSLGLKQLYGAEERHGGKHTQWLMTGAGVLHEEMWDIQTPNFFEPSRQELFQLWLNVPSSFKLDPPQVHLLGGKDETPTVNIYADEKLQSSTIVIAGEYADRQASVNTLSKVHILHVRISPNSTWSHSLPPACDTAIIYMREGSAYVGSTRIPPHYTAYLGSSSKDQVVVSTNPNECADFIFLSGESLKEPVAAQGSMVMNTDYEIRQAYADYQSGKMGVPWDHTLSDSEWENHLRKYPSFYKVVSKK